MNTSIEYFKSLDWAAVIGRLHPLVLHLPVALFLILFLFEFPALLRRRESKPDASKRLLVRLLVLSAPMAALSGWLLHEGGGYGPEVEWHEYLGIATCVIALWVGYAFRKQQRHYPLLVCIGFGLMIPTAHLGGSLTHGEDFLFGPWQRSAPAEAPEELAVSSPSTEHASALAATALGDAAALARVRSFDSVAPIFEARCGKCHGASRQRAGLSLASIGSILAGGESGQAMLPGAAQDSLIMQRLRLPLEHEDHMPPASKTQPSEAEIASIGAWIDAQEVGQLGGSEQAPRSVASALPVVATGSRAGASPDIAPASGQTPPRSAAVPMPADEDLLALRARLIHVERVAPELPGLWLDFEACALNPGELRELLSPLAAHVERLSLAGKSLDAEDLLVVAGLPGLEHLDLRRLSGDPLDLSPLASSSSLRVLNLSGSALAAGALPVLNRMASLVRVYLWDTGLSEAQLQALASVRPELSVQGPSAPSDAPLEVEPEVRFTEIEAAPKDAPTGD